MIRISALAVACVLALSCADVARACCPPEVAVETIFPVVGGRQARIGWLGADRLGGVQVLWYETDQVGTFLAISLDDGGSWGPPIPIATVDVNSTGAVDAEGRLVVAHSPSYGGPVTILSSPDQGQTLGAPLVVGTRRPLDWLSAVNEGGLAAVTWIDETIAGASLMVAVSMDAGATWAPSRAVYRGRNVSESTVVRIRDGLLLAWVEEAAPGAWELWAARSTDDGRTWRGTRVRRAGPKLFTPTFTTARDGWVQAMYLVDRAFVGAERAMHVTASGDDGATWPVADQELASCFNATGRVLGLPRGGAVVAWLGCSGTSVSTSEQGGLPGTWSDPPVLVPSGNSAFMASTHPGLLDLSANAGVSGSVGLTRSCDRGATWTAPFRIDTDAPPPAATSSLFMNVAAGRAGRLHVVFGDCCGGATTVAQVHHVGLDPPSAPTPTITVTETATGDWCRPVEHVLDIDAGSISGCIDPRFRWHVDGVPIAGATGPSHVVTEDLRAGGHDYHVLFNCADPVSTCAVVSNAIALEHVLPPTPVATAEISGPLRVTRAAQDLRLEWTDLPADASAYGVYEGTLEALWLERRHDHAAVACHVSRVPIGAPQAGIHLAPPSWNAYYLVTPADCRAEGLVGTDSLGAQRPVAGFGPACGLVLP